MSDYLNYLTKPTLDPISSDHWHSTVIIIYPKMFREYDSNYTLDVYKQLFNKIHFSFSSNSLKYYNDANSLILCTLLFI